MRTFNNFLQSKAKPHTEAWYNPLSWGQDQKPDVASQFRNEPAVQENPHLLRMLQIAVDKIGPDRAAKAFRAALQHGAQGAEFHFYKFLTEKKPIPPAGLKSSQATYKAPSSVDFTQKSQERDKKRGTAFDYDPSTGRGAPWGKSTI